MDSGRLEELIRLTGDTKKSPAVAKAVTDFVQHRKAREFGKLLREGSFDYPATNEEIEKQDV